MEKEIDKNAVVLKNDENAGAVQIRKDTELKSFPGVSG